MPPTLNERAWAVIESIRARAAELGIGAETIAGALVLDCGVRSPGSIAAGVEMARVCLADLASVNLTPGTIGNTPCDYVAVATDRPVEACMVSQYAGWRLRVGDYFAMASGPMRAQAGTESLYDSIGGREAAPVAVGVLETRQLPTAPVIAEFSRRLRLGADRIRLLAASAASQAGMVQIAARALETALHKLHELKFDIRLIESGLGTCPIPPVPPSELAAIGRGNDAVLYGSRVALWAQGDIDAWQSIGPLLPACASPAHGEPFEQIFERAGRDFYKIDPMFFSPAHVTVHHLPSGKRLEFGQLAPDVLARSFWQSAGA